MEYSALCINSNFDYSQTTFKFKHNSDFSVLMKHRLTFKAGILMTHTEPWNV